jgi:predicted MPP superfamily phosphohydrolase
LPRDLDGATIAQVSDLHVGEFTSERSLRAVVREVNALRADLVVHSGDLINAELSDLPGALNLARAMPGRFGSCLIEGNHDLFENGAEFARQARASGIPFLRNEAVTLRVRGQPVQFLGIRWSEAEGTAARDAGLARSVRTVLALREPDAFPILLAHHPHAFDPAAAAGLPLTLSGHTHGGQLMLNDHSGVGPILFRYWSGLYARGASQLVVSNGVGNWFPLRVQAPAEVVHLTLRRA